MLAVSKLLEKAWEICMDHLGGPERQGCLRYLNVPNHHAICTASSPSVAAPR